MLHFILKSDNKNQETICTVIVNNKYSLNCHRENAAWNLNIDPKIYFDNFSRRQPCAKLHIYFYILHTESLAWEKENL